jgi:4-amino-4-deoxy-L-arabinose transferase-like glycosyltransferase
MYIEKELNKSWKWILGLASALLLLPQLAMPELTSDEALYGMIARNAHNTGDYFSTVSQGLKVSTGHLYPWLVNCFGLFGVNEFTIRFPSILALAMMIAGAAFITYKYGGRQSAIVAGICMLSSYAAVKMGTRGEENMVGSAFLSISWLCWFQYSRDRKSWFKAWFYSLALVSVAAFSLGYYVFFMFYIPLLFLRKPTDVRKRIFLLPHFKALLIIITLHFIIFLFVTNLASSSTPELGLTLGETKDYSSGLFNFPFSAALYLLPWLFFCWTPYCAAFTAMEKDHVLFHFFRTVTVSLFITFWILPDSSPLSLIPVLPGLAIMTGLHYQILIRRYHHYIRKLVRVTLGVSVIANSGWLIIFGLNLSGLGTEAINELGLTKQWILINFGICTSALLLALFLLFLGRDFSVWLKTICMAIIGHWSLITYNSIPFEGNISNKDIGVQLAKNIDLNGTIINAKLKQHSVIMFYLDRKNTIHRTVTDNPENNYEFPNTVYVISDGKPPISLTNNPADYQWAPVSELLKGNRGFFQTWKGVKTAP